MRRAFLALLVVVAVTAAAAPGGGPRLVLDAKVPWQEDWAHFGGFSGLEVLDGGQDFLALSDRGRWARGTMTRGAEGRLRAAHLTGKGRLHDLRGTSKRGATSDSEGLAMDARGRAYISFEGQDRVRRYDKITGRAIPIPSHPDFARFPDNLGLEALAIDAGGTLYAIPEAPLAAGQPFPVYRLRNGRWDKPYRIRQRGDFRISDAAIGPDGKLYILERGFNWLGFRTRVRSFTIAPGALTDEATLLSTRLNELDNMEGISVWTDRKGRIRVTLISDDNFFALQRTEFAEYILDDD
jgi:hypothetical protein